VTTVDALVEAAAARSLPWPGDVPFRANLELLVDSCRRSAGLNAIGGEVLQKVAIRHLRNLRDLQEFVDDHPDVTARALDAPLVVTGLPRTGTTLLHNLLALDPAHRVLRFWEALRPVPGMADEAQAHAAAERWLAGFRRLVPAFQAIHPASATGPEECDALLQNSFASQHFDDMFDATDYSAWLAEAPLAAEYGLYALQLRVLSEPGARWALKSPSHLGHLDALLAALPGATVVICHRHPRQAVASYASLIHTLRQAYSDTASPATAGRQAMTRTSRAMARALAVRDRLPAGTVVDVAYDELVTDPAATVRRLYRDAGRELAPEVEKLVVEWAAAHPRHQHGPHRYDLARFRLTASEVDAAFAGYMDRFGALAGG
jgi:hypothetical protein